MKWSQRLWKDEAGVILSAEAVLVGTVAVIGLSTGLSVVATSVNEELKDVGFAIRSLDQSYGIPGVKGCCAFIAGSSFQQQDGSKSQSDLCDAPNTVDHSKKTKHAERPHAKKPSAEKKKKDANKNRETNSKKKPQPKI